MEHNPVYLTRENLANHSIVVGKTGTGKSTLLVSTAEQFQATGAE